MLAADLDACAGQHWDAIVIGTGIGGATLGHALARSGQRVLFCERGKSHLGSTSVIAGDYPERRLAGSVVPVDARAVALFRDSGRFVDPIRDESNPRRPRQFVPFIGEGTGGSSALYGMALERFFPSDFEPRSDRSGSAGTAPEEAGWPIRYADLEPHYGAAEALYRVRGTEDPLRRDIDPSRRLLTPPPLTSGSDELFRFFEGRGLHPYRLPMACEFVPGCQGCQGFICSQPCKNDATRICLEPAVREHGAVLLDECEVIRLEANRRRVTEVVCRRGGRVVTLHAAKVVLAAGALRTPELLLRSRSADWPAGLANDSGLVGRYLMRHFVDLYVIEPSQREEQPLENRFKELAFNDFYCRDGAKLGSVQSFGRLPPADMLFASLRQDLLDGPMRWAAGALHLARPWLQPFLSRMVAGNMVLATTLEDLPHADNRVLPPMTQSDPAIAMSYRIRPRERDRIRQFREAMRSVLKGRRWRLIKQAENNQRVAHVCGTCRFGSDPATSVLDAANRAHGLENLYVVDSSFFPSSGGTNPSLTIAANALRVAGGML